MTGIYYVIPVVALVLVVVLARWGQKRALASVQNMTPEQARARINDYFASSFQLQPGETLYATWLGEEVLPEQSAARQVAGAALNQLSKAAVGVSTYVPQVRVGLTSLGRVLVSREYSDMGERDNYKQVAAFGRGTRAVDAATARPGEDLKPRLANPLANQPAMEFVQFRAPSGEVYDVWMHSGQAGDQGFVAAFDGVVAQVPLGA